MTKFTSKTTKAEILRAYQVLLAEKEEMERVTPSVINDVEGLTIALKDLQQKTIPILTQHHQQLHQLIREAKRLKSSNDSRQNDLKSVYALEANTEEGLANLLAEFKETTRKADTAFEDKVNEHKDQLGSLLSARDRLQKTLELQRSKSLAQHQVGLQRAVEEFKYTQAMDQDKDELAKKREISRVEEAEKELNQNFSKYTKSKQDDVRKRFRNCEEVRTELEALRKKYNAEKESARAKGVSRAKREGLYELQKANASWNSIISQRKGSIESNVAEMNRNEEIKQELAAKLSKVEEDIQALSQASITASTKGPVMALHAVEKIALEQARSTANGKR
jgi:DNA repair exonuclease SbcCD ATPase subunit